MITIFNRKELTITFSMEKQAKVREILNANKIDYTLKTIDRNSPSAFSRTIGRTVTLGQNTNYSYEYIFYVHKDDVSKAKAIIDGNQKG